MPVQASITVTSGQVHVNPEPITLAGQGNGRVVIQWEIATDGWSFATNGIGIQDPNFEGGGPGGGGNRPRYTWVRKANGANGATVKYSISMFNGTDSIDVDPNIINQP